MTLDIDSQTRQLESPNMFNISAQSDESRTTLTRRPVMKSVCFHEPGDVRVDEVEEPVCGKGQVKVRFTPIATVHA